MKIRLLLAFLGIAMMGPLSAQDIHFTLFNMSPLTLNPALTGAYFGTARIGGIYRGQWYNVSSANGFKTPSFFIDAPIIRGFRENDWVGVGFVTVNDRAGMSFVNDAQQTLTGNLSTSYNLLSASYHLALDEDAKSVLTLGLQGGSVMRRLDQDALLYADEITFQNNALIKTPGTGMDAEGGNVRGNTNYIDFAAGLMLRTQFSNDSRLEIGGSVVHLTQPDYSLVTGGGGNEQDNAENRPMRITAHATYTTPLTEKWSLSPTAMFQSTRGGGSEIVPQVWAGYAIKEEVQLNFGLGYRFGDAANLLLGLDYEDLRVALSYDVNTSELSNVTDNQGAFELAAFYILKMYKKPTVKPAILCPQF